MKKIIILTVLAAAVFTSCQNNDPISDPNSSNNLSIGKIEMKVYPDKNNNVFFYAMTQKITIDWGDGTIDNLTPNGVGKSYSHVYSNQNLQTVKVNTENMTGDVSAVVNSGGTISTTYHFGFEMMAGLQEIEFGNCLELKVIECRGNQLTALDVSKCTALIYLDCSYNQLSASALNALFNSLPTRKSEDEATISIFENPGSPTCDKTIATKKGWWAVY